MSTGADFWGVIVAEELQSPLSIMREQALLLGGKTRNLIEARVDTSTYQDDFVHHFKLVIPTLDAYTYELFRVIQSMDLYPVTAEGKVCKNEEEFTEWLRVRLSDPKTTGTIGRLLTMVRA